MQVGDLVTSSGFGTRIGLVEKTWKATSIGKRRMVKVLWSNGETGNYYAGQLEVLNDS